MSEDDFEWHEHKANENLANHGISFQIAKLAFEDPAAVDWFEGHKDGEERYNILGLVHGRLLFVAYTIRNGRKRIISHDRRCDMKGASTTKAKNRMARNRKSETAVFDWSRVDSLTEEENLCRGRE